MSEETNEQNERTNEDCYGGRGRRRGSLDLLVDLRVHPLALRPLRPRRQGLGALSNPRDSLEPDELLSPDPVVLAHVDLAKVLEQGVSAGALARAGRAGRQAELGGEQRILPERENDLSRSQLFVAVPVQPVVKSAELGSERVRPELAHGDGDDCGGSGRRSPLRPPFRGRGHHGQSSAVDSAHDGSN